MTRIDPVISGLVSGDFSGASILSDFYYMRNEVILDCFPCFLATYK